MTPEFKEVLEALEDMVLQHCEKGDVISCGYLSANVEAIDILAKYGKVKITKFGSLTEAKHIQSKDRLVEGVVIAEDGRLIKPSICSECGANKNIQAHHYDYSKPLDVTWLCGKCHKAIHSSERKNVA